VRCLALFPNLCTIQLLHNSRRVEDSMATSFKGTVFPSVRSVNFECLSELFLSSFPEARYVSFVGNNLGPYRFAVDVLNKCIGLFPKVQVLRGFEEIGHRLLLQSKSYLLFISINQICLRFSDAPTLSKHSHSDHQYLYNTCGSLFHIWLRVAIVILYIAQFRKT
jgi:hypothetical protein